MLKTCSLEALLERNVIRDRKDAPLSDNVMKKAVAQTQGRISAAFHGVGKVKTRLKH